MITIIIKYFFLSERNILKVKSQATLSSVYDIADKSKKKLIIKYIIFFILGILFLGFFWVLLSSFSAVYQNTQIFIFKNTLISFAISICYPFLISILPSLFRIISLKTKTQNYECMFKLSKFLQIL